VPKEKATGGREVNPINLRCTVELFSRKRKRKGAKNSVCDSQDLRVIGGWLEYIPDFPGGGGRGKRTERGKKRKKGEISKARPSSDIVASDEMAEEGERKKVTFFLKLE